MRLVIWITDWGAPHRIIIGGSEAIISYDVFPLFNKDAEHCLPFYARGMQFKFAATNTGLSKKMDGI